MNTSFKSPCGMTAAYFDWPDSRIDEEPKGYYNVDFFLTIDKEAQNYFWAHQFPFIEGEVGYMGLQSGDHGLSKTAIFSIWKAKGAQGTNNGTAIPFDHEGSGYSCRINYNWFEGRKYRIRLWEIEKDITSRGKWWGAWVLDTVMLQEEYIGKILVPLSWGRISRNTVSFVEFWGLQDGRLYSCSEIPYSKATFNYPSVNNGTILPSNISYNAYGDCAIVAKITGTENDTYTTETGLEI